MEELGEGAERFEVGQRVGVPWLGWTDGDVQVLPLRPGEPVRRARFTGYDIDGGYAEPAVADERYCFPIPEGYPDLQAAPLLCAGLIGYRSLRLCGEQAERLGLYGFGASAHIVCQVAVHQGREVYALTRPGDEAASGSRSSSGRRGRATRRGVRGLRPREDGLPGPLDAAIIFAPVGELVPAALRAVAPGGAVVCAGIHMSDIPSFPYEILWGERILRSVANLTRQDGEEFLAWRREVPVRTEVAEYPLERANEALDDLRAAVGSAGASGGGGRQTDNDASGEEGDG